MKKYTHRDQIIKDIDSALRKIEKAKKVAQGYLDEEELLLGTDNVSEYRQARENADKQFRKIKRLETLRLPKLKEKLAEMDTIELPGTQPVAASPVPLPPPSPVAS